MSRVDLKASVSPLKAMPSSPSSVYSEKACQDVPAPAGNTVVKPHKGKVLLRYWLHLATVAATAGLASINLVSLHFIDSDDPNTNLKLNAFQFVAKLHELLICGSLMLIVMDCVRSRLISGRGLPLGYILSPTLFNSMDWLVSPEFWNSLKSSNGAWILTMLLLVAIPFANIAGPLSAILVVPRSGWSNPRPAAMFPTFWNSSADTFWPSKLQAKTLLAKCSTGGGDSTNSCPASALKGWSIILDPAFDNVILCAVSGTHVRCNATDSDTTTSINSISRHISSEFDTNSLSIVASTPDENIHAAAASRFDIGTALSLNISGTEVINAQKEETITVQFTGTQRMQKPAVKSTCSELNYSEIYQLITQANLEVNWTLPTVTWLGDLDNNTAPRFLFSFLRNSTSFDKPESCTGQACYAAIACSIDARWTPLELWFNTKQTNLLFQNDPNPQEIFSSDNFKQTKPIFIEKGWLELFNTEDLDFGTTMARMVNQWGTPMSGKPITNTQPGTIQTNQVQMTNFTQAVSFFLSHVLVEALANAPGAQIGESIYSGDCNDTRPGFVFASEICQFNPSHWITNKDLGNLQHQVSMATFQVQRYGYGWFFTGVTVKIALGVLLFHSLLTLIYLIKVIVFRRTVTTCWSSASELIVLAIDSLRAPQLIGSSTGVRNNKLWREPVSVREVHGSESLSLVVGNPMCYAGMVGDPPKLGKKYL